MIHRDDVASEEIQNYRWRNYQPEKQEAAEKLAKQPPPKKLAEEKANKAEKDLPPPPPKPKAPVGEDLPPP